MALFVALGEHVFDAEQDVTVVILLSSSLLLSSSVLVSLLSHSSLICELDENMVL